MTTVAVAAETVPERHYTHNTERGATPHRSNPVAIHRELTALRVEPGHNVLEIGTGSGYSGGLLGALVGEHGHVTSLDVNDHLVAWANLIHHERGVDTITCHTVDGTDGYPQAAPYDRVVAWCSPPYLSPALVDQVNEGGRIVVALPVADVPYLTVIATITVTDRRPAVEAVTAGAYIPTTSEPRTDFVLPGRLVDWSIQKDKTSWISIAWRADDDPLRTSARAALDLLLQAAHTETYPGAPLDWNSWKAYTAAAADPQLTVAELSGQALAIGHATARSAAVIHEDGRIVADSPTSPSLTALRSHLASWEEAGRPAVESFVATLVSSSDERNGGWGLRLSR